MRKIGFLLGRLLSGGWKLVRFIGPVTIIGVLLAFFLLSKVFNWGSQGLGWVDDHTKGIQHTGGSIISAVDCTLGGVTEDVLGQGTKHLSELNKELSDLQIKLEDAQDHDRWYVPNWMGDRGINDLTEQVDAKQAEIADQKRELEKMVACWASLKKIPAGGWNWVKDQFAALGDWGANQLEQLEGSGSTTTDDGENGDQAPVNEPDTLNSGKILFQ